MDPFWALRYATNVSRTFSLSFFFFCPERSLVYSTIGHTRSQCLISARHSLRTTGFSLICCLVLSATAEGRKPNFRLFFFSFFLQSLLEKVRANLHFAPRRCYLGFSECVKRFFLTFSLRRHIDVEQKYALILTVVSSLMETKWTEALFWICTGPWQLNQNQLVINELDETDAM